MAKRIAAILIGCLIAAAIYFVVKAARGVKLRYGVIGLILIIMPHALTIAIHPGDAWFSLTLALTVLVGALVLIWDITSKTPR